jgi:hypothetical protein
VRLAEGWTDDDHEEALACARDVVRRVRRGEFFDLGRPRVYEPIFEALIGKRLIHTVADGGDEERDA